MKKYKVEREEPETCNSKPRWFINYTDDGLRMAEVYSKSEAYQIAKALNKIRENKK